MALTILKNISQWEGLSNILWKINVPNHQPDINSLSHPFWPIEVQPLPVPTWQAISCGTWGLNQHMASAPPESLSVKQLQAAAMARRNREFTHEKSWFSMIFHSLLYVYRRVSWVSKYKKTWRSLITSPRLRDGISLWWSVCPEISSTSFTHQQFVASRNI